MNKEDVPQDPGSLGKMTREVCYATDDSGQYVTQLSTGWAVKNAALEAAWTDIDQRVAATREKVLTGEVSPVAFFMEVRLMDLPTLAAYTGFWKWRINRHLSPSGFAKLSAPQLQKYGEAFNVSVDQLKNMTLPDGDL